MCLCLEAALRLQCNVEPQRASKELNFTASPKSTPYVRGVCFLHFFFFFFFFLFFYFHSTWCVQKNGVPFHIRGDPFIIDFEPNSRLQPRPS